MYASCCVGMVNTRSALAHVLTAGFTVCTSHTCHTPATHPFTSRTSDACSPRPAPPQVAVSVTVSAAVAFAAGAAAAGGATAAVVGSVLAGTAGSATLGMLGVVQHFALSASVSANLSDP